MDEIDRAEEANQAFLDAVLAAHYRNRLHGDSATHCEDCHSSIPEERREAAPGCTRCIKCQSAFENHPRWRTP